MDSAVSNALAALKANPPHPDSTLPWKSDGGMVTTRDGLSVADTFFTADGPHIAAAVNAAPVLAAEVAKLAADLAALQVRFDELHSAATEVAEVARLRDEFNPPDDGRIWVSRWQNALSDLKEAVDNG